MKKILRLVMVLTALALLGAVNTGCTAKIRKAYHESRADKFYAAGNFDSAEIEYLNVLRNDNANEKAFARLGYIYFDQGRFQTAAPYLVHASGLATNDLEVRLKLGQILATAGRMKEAREQASFILDHNPQSTDAPLLLVQTVTTSQEAAAIRARLEGLVKTAGDRAAFNVALGTLAVREGDTKTAAADFKKALALDPKSVDAYEALGALMALQNDPAGAGANFKSASDLSPLRSTHRMIYARFKLQAGEIEAARQILDEVIKKAPDYIPALMGLAEIALATTNYTECRTDLTKILARDSGNFDGLMLDSRLRYAQGDLAGTIATLEQMARLYAQAPRVHFQLGAAYLAAGDDTKATVSINQALALDPNFADAIILLAEIQIRSKNPDPAIVSLGKLVQKYPQLVNAQLLLADGYRLKGRVNESMAIYTALARTAPNNAQVPLLAGSLWMQQGDKAKAREQFERSLAINPENLPAMEQLVDMDLAEGNYAAARQRIEARLGKSPNQMTLQLLVAKVQLAAGDRAGTEKTLRQAMEIDPQNDQPHLLLAQLYLDAKQTDKAGEELQAVVARNPRNLSAMMLLATTAEAAKDYKGAAAMYEKMLLVDPKCSPVLNNVAYLYSEFLGQLDRAYDLAQQARALLPFDPSTADTLGWICYKRGIYPTALSLLQESSAKLPDQAEVQYHYGMVNYMMGDEADARAALQRALADGKPFRGREEGQLCLGLLDINPQTADAGAQAKLEQRVADNANDPIAQGRLGMIYQRQGKADKAINCFEAVLKTDGKNLMAIKSLIPLYETKDAAKAYELAKTIYKLSPNDPDAAHLYGRLAYQNGDYKLASSVLQVATQNSPDDATLQFDYARANYSVGKVSAAQATLKAVLAANLPAAQAAEATRMSDLITQADAPSPAAAAQIASILKAEPDYVPALMVQARLSEQAGDVPAAIRACEKIMSRFPDFAPGQRELAILYSKDDTKANVAYPLAIKARESYPSDPTLAKATGIIVFQQGDFSRAASLLKDCAPKLSTDPEVYYYLGAAQSKLKQRIASKASLQQALTLKLSGPLADSARQMLNELK